MRPPTAIVLSAEKPVEIVRKLVAHSIEVRRNDAEGNSLSEIHKSGDHCDGSWPADDLRKSRPHLALS